MLMKGNGVMSSRAGRDLKSAGEGIAKGVMIIETTAGELTRDTMIGGKVTPGTIIAGETTEIKTRGGAMGGTTESTIIADEEKGTVKRRGKTIGETIEGGATGEMTEEAERGESTEEVTIEETIEELVTAAESAIEAGTTAESAAGTANPPSPAIQAGAGHLLLSRTHHHPPPSRKTQPRKTPIRACTLTASSGGPLKIWTTLLLLLHLIRHARRGIPALCHRDWSLSLSSLVALSTSRGPGCRRSISPPIILLETGRG
jgi:hypothetical protein